MDVGTRLHHSTIMSINGESYKLKDKRKTGLLGKPAKAHQFGFVCSWF